MKGFVPTPPVTVDLMVNKLFASGKPARAASILDPGCGPGAFIEGIIRWCKERDCPIPRVLGVDSAANHVQSARRKFTAYQSVEIRKQDFLDGSSRRTEIERIGSMIYEKCFRRFTKRDPRRFFWLQS